jgi:hypothetical protein
MVSYRWHCGTAEFLRLPAALIKLVRRASYPIGHDVDILSTVVECEDWTDPDYGDIRYDETCTRFN